MKVTEIIGYTGVITLNLVALLPIIAIKTGIVLNAAQVMAAFLIIGLILVGIRSIARKDLLNSINCAVGASLNFYLLTLLT